MSSPYLIVGLGNPGKKYEKTRHNAGFMAVDFLVGKKVKWQKSKKAKVLYLKTEINGQKTEIIKPQTYMNNSGVGVAYIVKKHGLKPNQIIVIYDEIDLPFGTIRIRNRGSSAGHKGIQSIIDYLNTDKFWRIRIGIRNDKAEKIPADRFVLQKFSYLEQKELKEKTLPEVVKKVKEIIDEL